MPKISMHTPRFWGIYRFEKPNRLNTKVSIQDNPCGYIRAMIDACRLDYDPIKFKFHLILLCIALDRIIKTNPEKLLREKELFHTVDYMLNFISENVPVIAMDEQVLLMVANGQLTTIRKLIAEFNEDAQDEAVDDDNAENYQKLRFMIQCISHHDMNLSEFLLAVMRLADQNIHHSNALSEDAENISHKTLLDFFVSMFCETNTPSVIINLARLVPTIWKDLNGDQGELIFARTIESKYSEDNSINKAAEKLAQELWYNSSQPQLPEGYIKSLYSFSPDLNDLADYFSPEQDSRSFQRQLYSLFNSCKTIELISLDTLRRTIKSEEPILNVQSIFFLVNNWDKLESEHEFYRSYLINAMLNQSEYLRFSVSFAVIELLDNFDGAQLNNIYQNFFYILNNTSKHEKLAEVVFTLTLEKSSEQEQHRFIDQICVSLADESQRKIFGSLIHILYRHYETMDSLYAKFKLEQLAEHQADNNESESAAGSNFTKITRGLS